MAIKDEVAKLKAIGKEADEVFEILKDLAKDDKKAPTTVLTRLKKMVEGLDASARAAARARRLEMIDDLTRRIDQYDLLLALDLSPASRDRIDAERAVLVAQRGYHRGKVGRDFEGIVSKKQAEQLDGLVRDVKSAVARKKKAIAHIDGAIRIGMAAAKIIALIGA